MASTQRTIDLATSTLELRTFRRAVLANCTTVRYRVYDVSSAAKRAAPVQVWPVAVGAWATATSIATGRYRAAWVPSTTQALGSYLVHWGFRATATSRWRTRRDEFELVSATSYSAPSSSGYGTLYDSIVARIEAIDVSASPLPEMPFRHLDDRDHLRLLVAKSLPRDRLFQLELNEAAEQGVTNISAIDLLSNVTVLVGYQVHERRRDVEHVVADDRRLLRNALLAPTADPQLYPAAGTWPAPLRGREAYLLAMPFEAIHSEASIGA